MVEQLVTAVAVCFRKKYGSFDYAPYRTPYDRRHVYMNNKLKCVNMMAAKRFKTAAFGKLAVRMKGDADFVIACHCYAFCVFLCVCFLDLCGKCDSTVCSAIFSRLQAPPKFGSNVNKIHGYIWKTAVKMKGDVYFDISCHCCAFCGVFSSFFPPYVASILCE